MSTLPHGKAEKGRVSSGGKVATAQQ